MEIPTLRADAPRADAAEHPLLLPHQLATLRAMLDIERDCDDLRLPRPRESVSTRHGVLGDKPGSGKSYVIADMLLNCGSGHIPPPPAARVSVSQHMTIVWGGDAGGRPLDANILVVPHNIVSQWTGVARHFAGGADRFSVISRSADVAKAADTLAEIERGESPTRLLIVSASLYPEVLGLLMANSLSVSRIVFDEADSLRFRSPGSYPWAARFYWFVTASVQNLFSGYAVGYSITVDHSDGPEVVTVSRRWAASQSAHIRSYFIATSPRWIRFVARAVVITDNAFIDKSFRLAPAATYTVSCTAPLHTRVLSGIASSDIVRRLNAGDLETAIMYMHPERADSERNIIAAALSRFDVELSNANAELEYTSRRRYATSAAAEAAVARQEAKVRRCEENIRNVRARIQEAVECSICYSDMRNKTVVPCCNNSFCLPCITTWVAASSPSCPLCKQPLETTDFLVCCDAPLSGGEEAYEIGGVSFDRTKSKTYNLCKLLSSIADGPDASERKLLFFCDNVYAIDHSGKQAMRSARIPFYALKGNSSSINKRVREFDEQPGPRALLVNCNYYGCGLNLSSATDVVIYHTMDSRMDQQIIGRAQRPPRASQLRVWRFVNCTEAEPPAAQ